MLKFNLINIQTKQVISENVEYHSNEKKLLIKNISDKKQKTTTLLLTLLKNVAERGNFQTTVSVLEDCIIIENTSDRYLTALINTAVNYGLYFTNDEIEKINEKNIKNIGILDTVIKLN